MVQKAANARERFERAAMALFQERGYAGTTVPEIAARAELTERTFYRYFADKPEVLFWRAGALQDSIVSRHRRRAGAHAAAVSGDGRVRSGRRVFRPEQAKREGAPEPCGRASRLPGARHDEVAGARVRHRGGVAGARHSCAGRPRGVGGGGRNLADRGRVVEQRRGGARFRPPPSPRRGPASDGRKWRKLLVRAAVRRHPASGRRLRCNWEPDPTGF